MRLKGLILIPALAGALSLTGCGDFFVAQGNGSAAVPVISPASESFSSSVSVTITDTNSSAVIYYTTDGTTPTSTNGTKYSAAITVTATETINAVAVLSGEPNSAVATATYTLATVATPTISPSSESFTGTVSVTITDSTSGATIYYTTDGTTPSSSNGSKYTAAFTVSSTETVQAVAVDTGYNNSAVASATYTQTQVATPVLSLATGNYTTPQTLTITDSTSGAAIYYTTDGTTPSATNGTLYIGAISITSQNAEKVQAVAVATGYANSLIASATYSVTPSGTVVVPTFTPPAGTYYAPQTVTLTDSSSGASIYYTTDGTTPSSTNGTLYATPITVSTTETVKAIGILSGYYDSSVQPAIYTLMVATPTFSVAAGNYSSSQSVTISTTTPSAKIYYTTDGSTPSTSSTLYTGAVTISDNTTLQAIGAETGYTPSAVASAAYTITLAAPTFSPAAGTYTATQSVTISDTNSGASIYYSTDGTMPSSSSSTSHLYSGAISVSATETIKAIAVESNYVSSAVSTAAYTIGTSATQDDIYVINGTTANLAAFKLAGSTPIASATIDVDSFSYAPTAVCVDTDNLLLYVGVPGAIYVYKINSDGSLTLGNSGVAVATGVSPVSMQVDATNDWLLVVDGTSSTAPVVYSYAKAPYTGALTLTQSTGVVYLDPGTPNQLLIAPNNQYVYVTLGTSGVDILNFSPNTGQLVRAGTLQPKYTLGSDVAMTVNYTSSLLFLTETVSKGVRVLSIGSQGALSEVLSSPFQTGMGPSSVALDPTGSYLYVSNRTDNTISGFSVSSTSGVLTALSGSPFATGKYPSALTFDKSKNYLVVVNAGGASSLSGSADVMLYSLDATNLGQLDLITGATTGSDPTGAFAVAATHYP
jgi:6-phosphogluconolactonase (cycloisomerase 2 family)